MGRDNITTIDIFAFYFWDRVVIFSSFRSKDTVFHYLFCFLALDAFEVNGFQNKANEMYTFKRRDDGSLDNTGNKANIHVSTMGRNSIFYITTNKMYRN